MSASRIAVALAAAAAAGAPAAAAAQEDGDIEWNLQLEGGSEYDSNVHRVETSDGQPGSVVGSPLARLGARQRLSWRRNPRQRFALSSHGGLKLFTTDEGQEEKRRHPVGRRRLRVGPAGARHRHRPVRKLLRRDPLLGLRGGRRHRPHLPHGQRRGQRHPRRSERAPAGGAGRIPGVPLQAGPQVRLDGRAPRPRLPEHHVARRSGPRRRRRVDRRHGRLPDRAPRLRRRRAHQRVRRRGQPGSQVHRADQPRSRRPQPLGRRRGGLHRAPGLQRALRAADQRLEQLRRVAGPPAAPVERDQRALQGPLPHRRGDGARPHLPRPAAGPARSAGAHLRLHRRGEPQLAQPAPVAAGRAQLGPSRAATRSTPTSSPTRS